MSAIHRISTQAERGRLAMICAKVLDNSSVLSLRGLETKAYGYKALQQTLLIIHPHPFTELALLFFRLFGIHVNHFES